MPLRCYALLVSLLIHSVAVAEPTNLLANGDFNESSAQALPAGWRGAQGDVPTIDRTNTPEGLGQSLQVEVQRQAKGYGQVVQRVSVKPGGIYRLTASLKSDEPGQAFYQIKLFKDGKEFERIPSVKSKRSWQRVELSFDTRQADRIEVICRYLQREKDLGKRVWFAGLRLVEVQPVAPSVTRASAVATFESIGVIVDYEGNASEQASCRLEYRIKGDSQWREALPAVHCPDDRQFRGSILNVQPGLDYEVRCELRDARYQADAPLGTATAAVRTWSHDVPIARTVRLPAGTSDQPLVINDRGTPDGWVLYTHAENASSEVDAETSAESAIHIENAEYVIIRNLTIRGGATHGIAVRQSKNIRIIRCNITGWGDAGVRQEGRKSGLYVDAEGKLINDQAGVHVDRGCSQIVIDGNFIHSPRGTSNTWQHGHPAGPQGIVLKNTDGNHVIRNNEIIGSEQHWFNDTIESRWNKYVIGGPYRDTDIHGNVVAFSNDDAVELDGGQINVRFYNNWAQWCFCGISSAPNREGPAYVFRNLFVLTGDERGRTNFAFKMGGNRFPHPGLTLLFHNTAVGDGMSIRTGGFGKGATPVFARNNIYATGGMRLTGTLEGNYDLDYDLITPGLMEGYPDWLQPNAVSGHATFVNAAEGDYRLADGSTGLDAGQALPTVNEDASKGQPDLGAFERGQDNADFPVRTDGMSALPLMQRIWCSTNGETTTPGEVRLTIPSSLGSRWTAHSNSPWLRCEPAEGDIKGSPQTVRLIPVDPLDVRKHRGAVTFRTDQGFSRTVMVELFARDSQPFALEIEAEDGQISGVFEQVTDRSASSGAFVHTPSTPVDSPKTPEGSEIAFTFDVPADGDYYILARGMAPGPNHMTKDSFFTAMNDTPPRRWDLLNGGSGQWHWMPINARDEHPRTFRLTKGSHTFRVISRERLARLDKIRITNEPFMPPGQ